MIKNSTSFSRIGWVIVHPRSLPICGKGYKAKRMTGKPLFFGNGILLAQLVCWSAD
jgi:hypothetical protein